MKLVIKKKYKKLLVCILTVALVAVSIAFAKYYYEYEKNSLYEAENFYFNSDLLKSEGTSYDFKKGVDFIKLNIANNIDSLRYTEIDTTYQVVITDMAGNTIVDKNGQTIDKITGTLSGDKINSEEITFSNLKDGTYKVVATALTPYVKQLEATFVISNNDNNVYYEVSDSAGSTVLYLTITTKDYNGNINITIPTGLLPDSNDVAMENVNIENSKTFSVNFKANSEYSFKFFKEEPQKVFTKSNFSIGK